MARRDACIRGSRVLAWIRGMCSRIREDMRAGWVRVNAMEWVREFRGGLKDAPLRTVGVMGVAAALSNAAWVLLLRPEVGLAGMVWRLLALGLSLAALAARPTDSVTLLAGSRVIAWMRRTTGNADHVR